MLFDVDKKIEEIRNDSGSCNDYSKIALLELTYETKQRLKLEQCFGMYADDQTYKFYTDGAWSMHHLVQYFLEQIGPSIVHISTWTLTENPARILLNLKEAGLIKELHALFDYRIQDRSPKSFQLIQSVCDRIKLTKCHAKVATMVNDQHGVSIVGSANFSKNRRLEAGTVFTSRISALFDQDFIKAKIDEPE